MNIIIIEPNKTFRESLKTVLNQIQDFNVVFDTDCINDLQSINNEAIDFMIIDYSLWEHAGNEIIMQILSVHPAAKFLLLANNKEECHYNRFKTIDAILKNSTKNEFEHKIRFLI